MRRLVPFIGVGSQELVIELFLVQVVSVLPRLRLQSVLFESVHVPDARTVDGMPFCLMQMSQWAVHAKESARHAANERQGLSRFTLSVFRKRIIFSIIVREKLVDGIQFITLLILLNLPIFSC